MCGASPTKFPSIDFDVLYSSAKNVSTVREAGACYAGCGCCYYYYRQRLLRESFDSSCSGYIRTLYPGLSAFIIFICGQYGSIQTLLLQQAQPVCHRLRAPKAHFLAAPLQANHQGPLLFQLSRAPAFVDWINRYLFYDSGFIIIMWPFIYLSLLENSGKPLSAEGWA